MDSATTQRQKGGDRSRGKAYSCIRNRAHVGFYIESCCGLPCFLFAWPLGLYFPIVCVLGYLSPLVAYPPCLRLEVFFLRSVKFPCYNIRTFFRSLGWFKLNDAFFFPGQSPRRLFESDREILKTSSMSLTAPDLTLICFVFLRDFSSAIIIWEIWEMSHLFRLNIFGEKNEKKTEIRPREGHMEHVCKMSGPIP